MTAHGASANIFEEAAPAETARPPWRLSGPVYAIYHILWWLIFIAVAAACINGIYHAREVRDGQLHAFLALGIEPTDGSLRFLMPDSAAAEAAGIVKGSKLIAVDGRPLGSSLRGTDLAARLLGAPGTSVRLRVEQPDGEVQDVKLVRQPAAAWTNKPMARVGHAINRYAPIPDAIQSLAAAALLLFRRRPDDPVVACLTLGMVLLQITSASTGNITIMLLFGSAAVGAIGPIGAGLLYAGMTMFPRAGLAPRWSRWVTAFIGLWAVVAATIVSQADLETWVILGGTPLSAIVMAVLIVRYRCLPPGEMRQQIRWALLGFSLGVLTLALGVIGFAVTFRLESWQRGGWMLMSIALTASGYILMWLGLLLSLLRYRLYDADAVVSRSVSYAVLTLGALAIFAGSEKVIELLGEEYLGERLGVLAGGLGAAVAAVMIVPLHHYVTHWAEHRFQKTLIHLRHDLPLLLGDLREIAGLDRVAAAALDAVTRGVRARHVALIVGTDLEGARGVATDMIEAWRENWTPPLRDGLDIDLADRLFPLRIPLEADGHGRVGWLLLGPRPDGSFYSTEERAVLADIADPIARAVQVVVRREARDMAARAEVATLRSELAELRQEVAQLLGGPGVASAGS